MKDMLYYPGYEVKSEDWLKFALLYIDKLQPIIPEAGNSHLSEQFSMIRNETDLIVPHRPSAEEGQAATLDAIDLVQKILQDPKHYADVLGHADYLSSWKMLENHQYTLFETKYSSVWRDFCLDENLAVSSDYGLKISRQLGLIYMSLLAHVISEKSGIEPITDHKEMDQISILTRAAPPTAQNKTALANRTVRLKLPGNINELGFGQIIEYRNKRDFKEMLYAFHSELEKHIAEMEGAETERTFLESRGSFISEFSDEIVSLGMGVSNLSLGVWAMTSNPPSAVDLASGLFGGGALIANSVVSIRTAFRNTKNTRLTRKYLVKLGDL